MHRFTIILPEIRIFRLKRGTSPAGVNELKKDSPDQFKVSLSPGDNRVVSRNLVLLTDDRNLKLKAHNSGTGKPRFYSNFELCSIFQIWSGCHRQS